ncbi:hypothetical protein [Rubripirellula reticaptiva]|uniref:Uncharacterized protein n=1 Tax=Rubripirellula reticaptiva TaxID=2528013 RepID=A0A5C6FAC2_9BACT|nr:hypothetical protein [Rubripirellula reticaptiva]TWU57364.1 hypothetical protein Poly59_02710 [Rubripirellula reticaptiva]
MKPERPPRFQIGLGSALFLMTILVVAMAWYRTHDQLVVARSELAGLRNIVRELEVDDPTKVTAVARMPTLMDQVVFDVYIPPPSETVPATVLCVALEGILERTDPTPVFPDEIISVDMAPGRHVIELRHDHADARVIDSQTHIQIVLNGDIVINEARPQSWSTGNSYSASMGVRQCVVSDPSERLEFMRRRMAAEMSPGSWRSVDGNEPANGILIWTEPK